MVKPAEQALDRVEHHPLGTDSVDGVANADEQPFQVVVAGFLDLLALDPDEVDDKLLLLGKVVKIEAQGPDVLRQLLGVLLERHEHTGLAVHGAAHQKFHGKQGLARSGAPADERRPAAWQAAAGDLVETPDATRGFGQTATDTLGNAGCFFHNPLPVSV